jgi:hypothetical protein
MRSVDKVIQILREMMTANSPGTGGAFGTKSPSEGPTAGKDTFIGDKKIQKRYIYGGKKSRKNWIDYFNSIKR